MADGSKKDSKESFEGSYDTIITNSELILMI